MWGLLTQWKIDYCSHPIPSRSLSNPCGSGRRTVKLLYGISLQSKSGGAGGIQTVDRTGRIVDWCEWTGEENLASKLMGLGSLLVGSHHRTRLPAIWSAPVGIVLPILPNALYLKGVAIKSLVCSVRLDRADYSSGLGGGG